MTAGKIRLENPVTGAVFDFGKPLPAVIARQVDNGTLRYPHDSHAEADGPGEPVSVPVLGEEETVPQPRGNASLGVWIDYAASQGMERAEAASLTRDEIRARFADPGFDPDAPPVMG